MRVTGITHIKHGALYRALEALGWSQSDLSRATGINTKYISDIVNLKARPTEKQRDAIEMALGRHGIGLDVLEEWPQWFRGVGHRALKIENEIDIPCERLLASASTGSPPQLDKALHDEKRQVIDNVLDTLPPRAAYVIRRRIYDGATLDTIADECGVSRSRIRQEEMRAFNKLRHPSCRKKLLEIVD